MHALVRTELGGLDDGVGEEEEEAEEGEEEGEDGLGDVVDGAGEAGARAQLGRPKQLRPPQPGEDGGGRPHAAVVARRRRRRVRVRVEHARRRLVVGVRLAGRHQRRPRLQLLLRDLVARALPHAHVRLRQLAPVVLEKKRSLEPKN